MNTNLQAKTLSADEAAKVLLAGGVGVVPTDTVYGLAARAADPKAVARLYGLKHRVRKPGTVIAASVEQVRALGIDARSVDRVKHFWPNPLSIVLPLPSGMSYLDQGLGDIAIRVVADLPLQKLLVQTGPLLTSSANQPGEPVSETAKQAWQYFGSTVDFYVDGGDLSGKLPSTLIAIKEDGAVRVIREGAVKIVDLNS